ncbi:MAG: hypothetical protein LOD91_10640, partial [Limnochordales bacterium]
MTQPMQETRAVWVEYPQDAMLAGEFNLDKVKQLIKECQELNVNTLLWLVKARTANYCELCRNNIQERFGPTVEHPQW